MRKLPLFVFFMALLSASAFAENMTMITFGAPPKGVDSNMVNGILLENLQDMNELLNNVYLRPGTLETYINALISNINSTNTNRVKQGSKMVVPAKISPLSLKILGADNYKKISNYMRLDNVIAVTYSQATGGVSVTMSLNTGMGVSLNKITFNLDLVQMSNRASVAPVVKENLVKLYKLEQRYFYDPARTGSVTITLSPKSATAYIPSINRVLKDGKNENIPWGAYNLVVSNQSNNTLLTNITVSDKTTVYKFTLQKFTPIPVQPGMPPVGNLYLDTDLAGTMFVIVEDGIIGRLPMMVTNIKAGAKTIVIQESPEFFGKKESVTVPENNFALAMISIPRKGSGFKINCNVEGAKVVLDRKIVGVISNGSFETVTVPSLHTLTLMKDRYFTFRTNISLNFNQKEQLTVSLTPKKPNGFVATPESPAVDIYNGTAKIGSTPGIITMTENDFTSLFAVATNVGYNNAMTNIAWKWDSENNFVISLAPLYGDLKIAVIPEGANIFVDNVWRGTNTNMPMLLLNLPARNMKVRVQKEGFRTFNTNLYVAPNMETRIDVKLKDAPARVFVGVFPDSGFDVYLNGDYAIRSGDGTSTLYLDYGKAEIKLNKRGYKTIVTNVIVTNVETMVLQVNSIPGVGEEDVFESASNYYRESARLLSQSNSLDILSGYSNLVSVTNILLSSEYGFLGTIRQFASNAVQRITEIRPMVQVADIDLKVVKIQQDAAAAFEKQDYSNDLALLKSAVQLIEDSTVAKEPAMVASKDAISREIERVNRISAQSSVRKMLREAIDMADRKDFQNAIDKLKNGLDLVNTPSIAADPDIITLRDGITNELAKLARYDVIFSVQKAQKEIQSLAAQTNAGVSTNSIDRIRTTIQTIRQSSVTADPEVAALLLQLSNQLIDANWGRLSLLVQVEEDAADKARDAGDFDIAVDKYDRLTTEMATSDIPEDPRVLDAKKRIAIKKDEAKKKWEEKETLNDARKLIESVNPMITDADKLSEDFKFNEAIKLYNEAIKKIENSTYRDNPKVQERTKMIEKRLKKTQEDNAKRNEWFAVVSRNWQGFSFDFLGTYISAGSLEQLFSPDFSSMSPSNSALTLNSPEYLKMTFHILPFLDFSLGGVFNLNLPVLASPVVTNLGTNIKPWIGTSSGAMSGGFVLGPGVRIPIWSFVSLYGDANLVVDLANTSSILNNFNASAGMDLKAGVLGLKLYYQWAWKDAMKAPKLYQGVGAGLVLWLTEE